MKILIAHKASEGLPTGPLKKYIVEEFFPDHENRSRIVTVLAFQEDSKYDLERWKDVDIWYEDAEINGPLDRIN